MADCENPYPLWKPPRGGDQLRDNDMHIAFNEGQQNPDPKQYANREELVERIKEGYEPRGDLSAYKTACGIMDIILKHGLEE